jgi:Ubiquitin binding region
MSSAVEVPMRSVHHRRPVVWLIVAFVAAFALAAGVLIVHDSGTDSAVESHAAFAAPVATVPATPTVCWSQYGSLLAVMDTSMTPEAVNRITPVLSEETRTGLLDATAVLAVTNSASPMPDPVTLAWAIGRLTPAEGAAIMAELPPALQEAVANQAAESAAILATLPPEIQEAVATGALDAGLVGNPCP